MEVIKMLVIFTIELICKLIIENILRVTEQQNNSAVLIRVIIVVPSQVVYFQKSN